MDIEKAISLFLGLILAFVVVIGAIYLSTIPNGLTNNAFLLFIGIIVAIVLIYYGKSED